VECGGGGEVGVGEVGGKKGGMVWIWEIYCSLLYDTFGIHSVVRPGGGLWFWKKSRHGAVDGGIICVCDRA
jgi:hypothetical protein